jgi:micrococcal nuclease
MALPAKDSALGSVHYPHLSSSFPFGRRPIRLSGIDCHEKGQAYGKRVKQAASVLPFGKEVTLQTHGYDKYKRTIGDVILLDGINLNQELVKQGWCWWYRTYAPGNTVLEG